MPNNTQQRVKMNISLDELKTITCPNCENAVFKADLCMFKKLSGVQSPTGKAQLIKVELMTCPVCRSCYVIKEAELFPITELNGQSPFLKEYKVKE